MKKLVFTMLFASMLFSACIQNKTEDSGYNRCICPQNTVGLFTTYFDVYPTDWRGTNPLESEQYVYATFDLESITKNVIENGAVLAYFLDGAGRDNVLPYVYPLEVSLDPSKKDTIMQNMRYDISEKQITFIMENSNKELLYPAVGDTLKFKVSVLSPN